MDIRDTNALRHAENVTPILRGITTTQRHVTAAELDLATARRVPGTFKILALVRDTGSAREVWR